MNYYFFDIKNEKTPIGVHIQLIKISSIEISGFKLHNFIKFETHEFKTLTEIMFVYIYI